ncbi:MAG: type IV pilin protein [Gammaproteobacteria bacterium]
MIRTQNGFTLIEAIVTVAIIAIIASIAVNYYEEQKRRGYRQEAISALTEMSVRQEREFSKLGHYTNDMTKLYRATTTTNGKYNLSATYGTSPDVYLLTATATASQTADTDCARFTLNQLGERLAYDDSNAVSTRNCWSR